MTFLLLIRRSLRFHARSHIGVVLGAAIGSAALIGALIVGDSVRGSLRERAMRRLGGIEFAMNTGDRFFQQNLEERIRTNAATSATRGNADSAVLELPGVAIRPDGGARANQVHVLGIDLSTWSGLTRIRDPHQVGLSSDQREHWMAGEMVLLNEVLSKKLGVAEGGEIILRIRKPTQLAQDAVIVPRDDSSLALRLKVGPLLSGDALGDFSLTANQSPPANAFLPLDFLARKLDLSGQANLLLNGPIPGDPGKALPVLDSRLDNGFALEDAQLFVRSIEQPQTATGGTSVAPSIEIGSSRIFLEPTVAAAAAPQAGPDAPALTNTNRTRILTYLCNLIRGGDHATPYSMVTAVDAGRFFPPEMRDDEILINQWLADDLQAKPGHKIDLSYYAVDSASRLTERTNSFRVRAIVPLQGVYADRTLMPEFPGVAKAESTQDWDTGFPLVYKIRDKDEAYWKRYRGTPKAFITLAAGQAMWASRFGDLTAIRYEIPANIRAQTYRDAVYKNLRARLNPTELGFHFEPVREQALRAAEQSQDFGQLFIGFSIFLVVAALLLMALLFQLSLEQRRAEVGTLLAVGLRGKQVRRLILGEGIVLALVGGGFGAAAGIGYAKAMLWALTTVWRDAVGTSVLHFYVSAATLFTGFFASAIVAIIVIWVALRRQARQPARELLANDPTDQKMPTGRIAKWVAAVTGVGGLALTLYVIARGQTADAEAFFEAGSLLLIAGLAAVSAWLAILARKSQAHSVGFAGLGVRGCARRRNRSLSTVALLACGCFVIVSIGAFRLDANQDANKHSSGTGGFALIGEASLPVVQDLNSQGGREFFGLNPKELEGVSVVPCRVHDGDEASCLNLNRAQKPRILGVKPEYMADRFTFAAAAKGLDIHRGWDLLKPSGDGSPAVAADEVPAIGDANAIEWALGKSVGDTLDYTDEHGRVFKLRLVAAVANSVLQGSLIIDEAEFVKKFPGTSGYRYFLLDAPAGAVANVSTALSRALQDIGLELTPAPQRLNAFNAVQNTYLGTFQILGGLGLLLGSAGLGVVVLRNVLERRGELGLMLAVGFRKRALQWLVLAEHGVLLVLGLGLGLVTATVAVLPALLSPARQLPYGSLAITLSAVLLNGVLWTWLATRVALRGNLLAALRNE